MDANLAGYEIAHLWGPGFGDEARAGMMLAPAEVNQWLQNRGVEQRLRELQKLAGDNATIHVKARAASYATNSNRGHAILKHVSYTFELQRRGSSRRELIGEVDIHVPPPPADSKRIRKDVTGGLAGVWSLT